MKLRELRKERGISMKKLGEYVGVSESTISLYETGKHEPSKEMLLKFADFFGVSVDYLLGREEIKKPIPEDELDKEIIERFSKLSATDAAKVSAFIEGLLAAKE